MRPSIIAFFSLLSVATATRTFNITAALQPGNFDKYHCATTEQVVNLLPSCLASCQRNANANDGCAYDDIACHCVNYVKYSSLIEPCAFPPNGSCTFADLTIARPIVNDLCNFFNATLYAAYDKCNQTLSPDLTNCIIAKEDTVITE
ncbi:hypothetical protein K491DRAFT_723603 [Lophiostoma macrostomum CBS 122681]|uniref:CFEM domain-containing protein n=1 Tax=Lophiostoma macrostomum CBS 122681 TaxID=1314788 RepID=A0A6A6SHJ5_9PLEO|nr:hypothetical protein K491DRAFT_723603 [Lophiostoma macrostomum CBS 122681]